MRKTTTILAAIAALSVGAATASAQSNQGAIDMAQIQLRHGSDADAKRIAQQTIDENTEGKAELQAWLKAHGG
jgi:hypothetical protein